MGAFWMSPRACKRDSNPPLLQVFVGEKCEISNRLDLIEKCRFLAFWRAVVKYLSANQGMSLGMSGNEPTHNHNGIIGSVIEKNAATKTFRLMFAHPVSPRSVNGPEAKVVSVSLPSPEKCPGHPQEAATYQQVLHRMSIDEAIAATLVSGNASQQDSNNVRFTSTRRKLRERKVAVTFQVLFNSCFCSLFCS